MINSSLLPKALLLQSAREKLTSILADYEVYCADINAPLENLYDIFAANEEQLQNLIDSFSLGDLYTNLPVKYKGALLSEEGVAYSPVINKVAFMRRFLNSLLKSRKNIGTLDIFNIALSILDEQSKSLALFQNYLFTSAAGVEQIVKKLYYTNVNVPTEWQIAPKGVSSVVVTNTLYVDSYEAFINDGELKIWTYYNNIKKVVTVSTVAAGIGTLVGDIDPTGTNQIDLVNGSLDVTFDFNADGGSSDTPVYISYSYDRINYLLTAGYFGSPGLGYVRKDITPVYNGKIKLNLSVLNGTFALAEIINGSTYQAKAKVTYVGLNYILVDMLNDYNFVAGETITGTNYSNPPVGDYTTATLSSIVNLESEIVPNNADTNYTPTNLSGYYTPTNTLTIEIATATGALDVSVEFLIALKEIFKFLKNIQSVLTDIGTTVSMSTENSLFNINQSYNGYAKAYYNTITEGNSTLLGKHHLYTADADSYGDVQDHSFDNGLGERITEQEDFSVHAAIHQPGPVPELATLGTYAERSSASQRANRLDVTKNNDLNPQVGGALSVWSEVGGGIGDCYVEVGEKYLIKKAAASDPFASIAENDQLNLLINDGSESTTLYACSVGVDLGGGIWGLYAAGSQYEVRGDGISFTQDGTPGAAQPDTPLVITPFIGVYTYRTGVHPLFQIKVLPADGVLQKNIPAVGGVALAVQDATIGAVQYVVPPPDIYTEDSNVSALALNPLDAYDNLTEHTNLILLKV